MENLSESKLLHCMERVQRGEELTVGFLGGSITQGPFQRHISTTSMEGLAEQPHTLAYQGQ